MPAAVMPVLRQVVETAILGGVAGAAVEARYSRDDAAAR